MIDAEKRGDWQRVVSYCADVVSGRAEPEAAILRYALATAGVLLVAGFAALGFPPLAAIGSPLFIALGFLCAIMGVSSYTHIDAYRDKMCCVNGMMAGMAGGMGAGFLVGALIGATNGMFIGSIAGSAAGIWMGVALGKSSGIMGAMEGMMAGLMSGTMGAMLSVMMINDNLEAFLLLLFGACIIIFGSLSYMMRREAGPAPVGTAPGYLGFLGASLGLGAIIALIMLIGPRGPITV